MRLGVLHGTEQDWIIEKLARGDHFVEASDVHVDDTSGANVQVAHFAVAHLPFGKADGRAGRLHQRVRVLAQEGIVGGLARGGDGIALRGRGKTPAVENRQN